MQKIIRTSTIPLSLDLFCRGLLRELAQEYEVVAVSSPDEELASLGEREGVRTEGVRMSRRIAPLSDLRALRRLVRLFRRERPQMVHSITPKAGLLSMLAARIADVPVRVHTFTGLVFPTVSGWRRGLLMLTDKITCRCATHVIAEGEGVRNDLLQYGITEGEVEILGYGNVRGVDLDYYDRTAETEAEAERIKMAIGAVPSTFTFVFAGRLVRDKGVEELVEAFCRLSDEGFDIRLLLVGGEECDDPVSESAKEQMAGRPNIVRAGWQSDVRPYYAASDALVLPSYREGFPNVVLEAGAMGLPSIVTDINGSREIIAEGLNGTVVPAGNAEALYEAMRDMLVCPDDVKAMGGRARAMVAERYEQGFVRRELKKFYKRVLSDV